MFRALEAAAAKAAGSQLHQDQVMEHLIWLHKQRQKARVMRDFERSDEIRHQLELMGVDILALEKELKGAFRTKVTRWELEAAANGPCTCDGGGTLCRACRAEKALKELK